MSQGMSDVLIFVDSNNIYHAFQPLRALSAERFEHLTALLQALSKFLTMPQIHGEPGLEDAEAKLTLAILQTLLPTVNPTELERLDMNTRRVYLIGWDKVQPKSILTPTA